MDVIVRGLIISAIGISVVFITLLALQGFLLILNMLGNPKQKGGQVQPAPEPVSSGVPPSHIAAIAAALAIQEQGYRIRSIKIAAHPNWEHSRLTEFSDSDC